MIPERPDDSAGKPLGNRDGPSRNSFRLLLSRLLVSCHRTVVRNRPGDTARQPATAARQNSRYNRFRSALGHKGALRRSNGKRRHGQPIINPQTEVFSRAGVAAGRSLELGGYEWYGTVAANCGGPERGSVREIASGAGPAMGAAPTCKPTAATRSASGVWA